VTSSAATERSEACCVVGRQRRSATTSTSCWWAYCSRSASRAAVTPPYTTPRLPSGRPPGLPWPRLPTPRLVSRLGVFVAGRDQGPPRPGRHGGLSPDRVGDWRRDHVRRECPRPDATSHPRSSDPCADAGHRAEPEHAR